MPPTATLIGPFSQIQAITGQPSYKVAKAGIVTAQGGVRSALDCGRNVFLLEAYDKLVEPGATGLDGLNPQPDPPALVPAIVLRDSDSTPGLDTHEGFTESAGHSRSSSLWTAPSPSQKRRSRSPSLPALQSASRRGSYLQDFKSPPRQQGSENSAYYTALWGSPYDLPSSSKISPVGHRRRSTDSTITANGSPPSILRIYSNPASSPGQGERSAFEGSSGNPRSTRRSVRDSGLKRPRFGFTQDWLQTHLARRKNVEKGNWFSDDSGGSDNEVLKNEPEPLADIAEAWLDFGPDDQTVAPTKTTGLASRKPPANPSRSKGTAGTTLHRASPSDATLTQQDFDDIFRPIPEVGAEKVLAAIAQGAVPRRAMAPSPEKALPPPPHNRTTSEAPVTASAVNSTALSENFRPSASANVSFQRPKKKVMWRGKNCVIALPFEDGVEKSYRRKEYLKPQEVKDRIVRWQESGFRTDGFDLSEVSQGDRMPHGQSRDVYPDHADWHDEQQNRKYRISIPDRKAWEQYVTQLKEQKLRALGVSFGDDEPPSSKSPALSSISRQPSSQTITPSSFAGQSSSATSVRAPVDHAFSPILSGSSNPFPYPPSSVVSPGPGQYGPPSGPHLSGYHFPRQSMVLPGDQTFVRANQLSPQPTPPISGPRNNQQQYFGAVPGSRGVSPLLGGRQSVQASHSPVSPMLDVASEGFFAGQNNPASFLRRQQSPRSMALSQPPLQMQLQHNDIRATLGASHGQTANLQPLQFLSQAEIESPLPQGHRHNLSETLQREIDEAEYHLEESISRQLEEDVYSSVEYNAGPSSQTPTIHNPGVLKNKIHTYTSDMDTNPSIPGSPILAESDGNSRRVAPVQNPRSHRSSLSKLNVNAQEFVSDSFKVHAPSVFSFGPNASSFVPTQPSSARPLLRNPNSRSASNTSTFSSNLNVAAPAFTPSNFQISAPSREFSFSSKVPVLKPDAPSFVPGAGRRETSGVEVSGADKPPARIFGNFNLETLNIPKRSKAIPIVKPNREQDVPRLESESELEDESGRPIQAIGRQKRLRKTQGDGDQVPLFATPSREILMEPISTIGVPRHMSPSIEARTDEDMTSPIEKATVQLKGLLDDLHGSPSSSSDEQSKHKEEVKKWEAFKFRDEEDAAMFSVARPRSPSPTISTSSLRGAEDEEKADDAVRSIEAVEHVDVSTLVKKTVLSPTAKPFEFKAFADAFVPAAQPMGSILATMSNKTVANSLAPVLIAHPPTIGEPSPSVAALQSLVASPSLISTASSPRFIPTQPKQGGLAASRWGPQEPESEATPQVAAKAPPTVVETPKVEMSANVLQPGSSPFVEPSYQEIDAVMKELNGTDSDAGVERLDVSRLSHSPERSIVTDSVSHDFAPNSALSYRHSPPSEEYLRPSNPIANASPNKLKEPFQYLPTHDYGSSDSAGAELVARNARFSPSFKPSKHDGSEYGSPVHHLNAEGKASISDWDDVVSPADEADFQARSGFFDHRVNDMIGSVIQERLLPLERNIQSISVLLARMSSRSSSRRQRRSASAEIESSDADDEDDQMASQVKSMSPAKDRKFDKLKASLLESIFAQQLKAPTMELTNIMETLTGLKASLHEQHTEFSENITTLVEESVAKSMVEISELNNSAREPSEAEELRFQITGLENLLRLSEARGDEEMKARRLAEDALAENQRHLRAAHLDVAEHLELAEKSAKNLREHDDERQHFKNRTRMLEDAQENLKTTVANLTDNNTALEETIAEYRVSHTEWRKEMDESKIQNSNLNRTIHALKGELEDGIRGRQALRNKFDRIQEDMKNTVGVIARDASAWRNKEEEFKARLDHQNARLEADARTRERLESEIERLGAQEKEAMKGRFLVEQIEGEKARLSGLLDEVRLENHAHLDRVALLERELHDVKETGQLEAQRWRQMVEAEKAAAAQQVEIAKAEVQTNNEKLAYQLENAKSDASIAKSRYQFMLDEASDSKNNALLEAADAREAALQEHYRFHERTLGEMKASQERALAAMAENGLRELKLAQEHELMTETHLKNRLSLSEEKLSHQQDRVAHLEEKLEITKSAAQAAIKAAQSAKGGILTASLANRRPSGPLDRASDVPEKVSPQALRESILVLQEQLQEREIQIERLEEEMAKVDTNAPAKIKERDVEISWLRELLGVRIDDLQDIIATLSSASYDRDSVRDAAIRLKANLQMEQQEKERAMAGGQTFPSLASISNLAASPRSLPLAAAAAWGNWRKGQSSMGSLAEIANGSVRQTPSRSSPQSFLSGLLTPPATSARSTPQPSESNTSSRPSISAPSAQRPLRGYTTPRRQLSSQENHKALSEQPPPLTPTLLRTASYDQDAQSGHYSLARYVEDDDSTADGHVRMEGDDGLFGPSLDA